MMPFLLAAANGTVHYTTYLYVQHDDVSHILYVYTFDQKSDSYYVTWLFSKMHSNADGY